MLFSRSKANKIKGKPEEVLSDKEESKALKEESVISQSQKTSKMEGRFWLREMIMWLF